jgi:hypothetical protein
MPGGNGESWDILRRSIAPIVRPSQLLDGNPLGLCRILEIVSAALYVYATSSTLQTLIRQAWNDQSLDNPSQPDPKA